MIINAAGMHALMRKKTPLKEVLYAHDVAGRLQTVTDWANRVTTYSYDAIGRMIQLLRPNGTKQVRAYDAAGQLTQLTELATDGVTVIYSGTHSYDDAGQLAGETLTPGLTPVVASVTQTFDADNRLLTHNGSATAFDADGNLLSVATGVTPSSYTYDARNRLTSAGGLTYGYNAENRRVSLTDATGTTTYVVNPNAAPDQVLVRTAPDGTKTFYAYGLGLLHEETGSTVRYYHHDRRGDTIALTDGTGAVTDRASYGVYGELLSRTGTTNTPFLFNGRWGVQTDSNGLYQLRARYYHPALRRFLNQDTVLGSIGSSASLNRFAYANGNPVSLIDPFGLMAGDAPNSTATTSTGVTTVQLLGRQVDGAPSGDLHGSILISGNGQALVISAQPTPKVQGVNTLLNMLGKDVGSVIMPQTPTAPGSSGEFAKYQNSSTHDASPVFIVNQGFDQTVAQINTFNAAVRSQNVPYYTLTQNSNSYAFTLLQVLTGQPYSGSSSYYGAGTWISTPAAPKPPPDPHP